MSPDDLTLRASDDEREHAADQLRAHCALGRLTADELDERTDAAFAARTVGDLQALLADLPALPAAPPRPDHDSGREAGRNRVLHSAGWWALLFAVFVVAWIASGASGEFWPIWILLIGAVRMLFVSWAELGPGAEERRRRRSGRGSSAPLPPPQQTQRPPDAR